MVVLDVVGNVGIQGGRIEVVTDSKITGKQTIDARVSSSGSDF